MHTYCFISLLVCLSSQLTIRATDSDYDIPKTVDDLRTSLLDLGFEGADAVVQAAQIRTREVGSSPRCPITCKILSLILDDGVSIAGSPAYLRDQNRYWSNQQLEARPACRVKPTDAKQVAATVLVTAFLACPFAMKSGGHAAFKGASNIDGGITIDLVNLNYFKVNEAKTITSVGAGNRWIDVYQKLDPEGLSVVGGRVADIGVGGLTLGGGISFFSGRYGWALDGVVNYELVTANGRILQVNAKSYPDLYFALRGGGNNFGVVTQLDLETFPQGKMWGGFTVHSIDVAPEIYKASFDFANDADPDAALITAAAYAQGTYIFGNDYEYAKPIVNPSAFADFLKLPNLTSTARITTLSDLTLELNATNPSGFRQTYGTATFKNDNLLQEEILKIFQTEITPVLDATDILPAVVMQPITKAMISKFSKNGGNALGIAEADGPLNLMSLSISWSSQADDERILAIAARIIDKSVEEAKKRGKDNRYIYQNYASLGQDVFAGYGQQNKDRLIEISKRYDPGQIFQRLQPGYFKLSGQNGGTPT